MNTLDASVHRWTREIYERMAEEGLFRPDARVELVDGIIYDVPPPGSLHGMVTNAIAEALRTAFSGSLVRVQAPLALGEYSAPSPDIAVVEVGLWNDREEHRATALLVVEVSGDTLLQDRRVKLPLYARHGIPECWILNLREETLEVYRDSSDGLYRSRVSLIAGDTVSPAARPEAVIQVSDLMP